LLFFRCWRLNILWNKNRACSCLCLLHLRCKSLGWFAMLRGGTLRSGTLCTNSHCRRLKRAFGSRSARSLWWHSW
jgi:hypothetical protein